MGIPAFYRWLINRYPLSVVEAIEEAPVTSNGVTYPLDTSSPNPNEIEFDNLYIDMNGIVHPCFHPQDAFPPKSYDEVFQAVFKYIDRLFSIVRPRKVLYMAIDGVAPRAKMNQQRARRFRSAKDSADQKLSNVPVAHANEENVKMDSNVITPGTEFMELLSSALQYYIRLRMHNDPGWKDVKVILSDASVPGEGEHKIVSFIRLQRNLPGFDPNTRHCLYGLDADLIMLALATHEVHFTVLREDVLKSKTVYQRKRLRSGNFANEFDKCLSGQVFQLVHIWVLRDYLAHELQIPDPNTSTDFERLIDDFVFMCIFVGNDFLPRIPSLEIEEGAVDLLMTTYKKEFVQMGGYLTLSSEVNLKRVEHFIKAIGTYETSIFRKRNLIAEAMGRKRTYSQHSSAKEHNCGKTKKRNDIKEENFTIDQVKFDEDGWRERYYALKFEVQSDDKGNLIRKDAVNKYVEGICWIMHYYYQGVCSWNWFYPYHYAPFASDFHDIGHLEIRFDLGRPLKPFDQLMGVLPAASAQALPSFYRQLMTDSSSPILDFYPNDFEVDLNGKRHSWQGVCKLPFINEFRLLTEIAKVEHTLTDAEVRRNSLGQDVLFIHQDQPLAKIILSFWEETKSNPTLTDSAVRKEINPVLSAGMNGYMYIPKKSVCPAEDDSTIGGMEIINNNSVISVFYEAPLSHPHISKLPDGLILPGKLIISKDDIHPPAILWHERTAAMRSRFCQRPKPSNCISGPRLEMMAHSLVSENCVGKTQEVVSVMWKRWLHRKEDETNVAIGLIGTTNSVDVMKRVEELWNGHLTCGKRVEKGHLTCGKRKNSEDVMRKGEEMMTSRRTIDGRDVSVKSLQKRQKDGSKGKKVQSPGGQSKKNNTLFSCVNQLEVAEVGKILKHGEGDNCGKDCGALNEMNKDRDETSKKNDIQFPCGNQLTASQKSDGGVKLDVAEGEEILVHGEGEKGEIDCGVSLTASQKKNRRRKRRRDRNNIDKENINIQVPCENQLEVAEGEDIVIYGEDIVIHGEGEVREQDGGVRLDVAEGEEIVVNGEGEKGDTASQKTRKKRRKINKINNVDKEKDDIAEGEKEQDGRVLEVPCENQLEVAEGKDIVIHGEGEMREQEGGVKLDVAKGEEILVHGEGEKGEIDCGVKLTASQKKNRRRKRRDRNNIDKENNNIQVPCENQLEVAEGVDIVIHGEGEMREQDGGVKLDVVEGEEVVVNGEGEKGDTTSQKTRKKRRKITKINNVDKEKDNIAEGEKEQDGGVPEVPCENQLEVAEGKDIAIHGEGEMREQDGGVNGEGEKGDTASQKTRKKRRKINKINDIDKEKDAIAEGEKEQDGGVLEVPCGNQLEVAEG